MIPRMFVGTLNVATCRTDFKSAVSRISRPQPVSDSGALPAGRPLSRRLETGTTRFGLMPIRSGFTLIELLVVISILGVLAGLLLPVLSRGKNTAQGIACISNLHQIGIALALYVQDNNHRLPVCAQMPSLNTNLPAFNHTLAPYLQSKPIWKCPSDRTFFPTEEISYEWNMFLNGASYDRPQDWSPVTKTIVETIFGGRINTPLVGDADAFHGAKGIWTGKNALYFDGRVEKAKSKP